MRDKIEADDAALRIEHFEFSSLGTPFFRNERIPVDALEEGRDGKTRGVVRNSEQPGCGGVAVFDLEIASDDHDAFRDGIEDIFEKSLFFFRQLPDAFRRGRYGFFCHFVSLSCA